MELTELKPCPFCGSTDIGGASGIVSCYGCHTETRKHPTTDLAIAAWNRRATGELTSPEYISRLRGVMGPGEGEVVGQVCNRNESANMFQDLFISADWSKLKLGDIIYIHPASPVAGEVKG